jgi:hypothetical protein
MGDVLTSDDTVSEGEDGHGALGLAAPDLHPLLLHSHRLVRQSKVLFLNQCCGSGSGRIHIILPTYFCEKFEFELKYFINITPDK